MGGRLHEDNCVSVWQGKHDLDARARISRNSADGISAGIDHVPGCVQLSHPGCLHQPVGWVAHLQYPAAHSPAAVQRRQGDIQLLQTSAEEYGKRGAEWPEQTVPLRPGVKLVMRGLLIEVLDRRRDIRWIEGASGQPIEAVDESTRSIFREDEVVPWRIVGEEIFADEPGISDGAVEPGIRRDADSSTGRAHPLLCDPVTQISRSLPEPYHDGIMP